MTVHASMTVAVLIFSNKDIQQLIADRGWNDLTDFERIKSIYNYVRDEIKFGYNTDGSISASRVLSDGYGQCNTKGTLFMALLRACNIPCRVHGFTNPVIDFDRNNTYIQSEGINQDFGVYDSPDELLREHHQEMLTVKAFVYRNIGRHLMDRNVRKIRDKRI